MNCEAVTQVTALNPDRSVQSANIWLRSNLDYVGVAKLMLHEIGHLHGLADMPASDAGRTVMANQITVAQRLDFITACDQAQAAQAARMLPINVPPPGGGCPPGGCQTPGLPCSSSSFDQGSGWCYPDAIGGGASVVTDWWWYLFASSNIVPSVAITWPQNGAVFQAPYSGVVAIDGIDPNGRIMKVEYYANGQFAYSSISWPFTMPVSNVGPGTYEIQVKAFDNRGEWSWSAPIWVTVQGTSGGGGVNNVALWSHASGMFVAAEGGGGTVLVANRWPNIGPWETFRLISLGGSTYALQAHAGHYVTADLGGGSYVLADRSTIGPWETFELVHLGGNDYAFRTINGHFLTVDPYLGAIVSAQAGAIGPWERFNVHWLP